MKRVFIFGAGPSIKTPSFHFKNISRKSEIEIPSLTALLERIYCFLNEKGKAFFEKYFAIRYDKSRKTLSNPYQYNFEEVFNIIHTAAHFFKSNFMHPNLETDGNLDQLIDFDNTEDNLLRALVKAVSWYPPEISEPHLYFVKKILESDDVIVTFNYDLVIDNALLYSGRWFPNDGYAIPFWNIGDAPNKSSTLLLKLHGSINWFRFSGNFRKKHTEDVGEYSLEGFRNNYLYSLTNPSPQMPPRNENYHANLDHRLIVPPLIQKNTLAYKALSRLWYQFHQRLLACDEIWILGYSMPQSDLWIRDFFKITAAERKISNKKPPQVSVVNPSQKTLDDLAKFFKEKLHWGCSPIRKTFQEWIDNWS